MINIFLKLALVLLLFLMTRPCARAQDSIAWKKDNQLRWSDFKGRVDTSSAYRSFGSLSWYGIFYSFSGKQVNGRYEVTINVTTDFIRSKSWVRVGIDEAALLRHEQLHFDIAELFARKLRAIFKTMTFSENFKNEISAIYESLNKAHLAVQKAYDTETCHSVDKAKQLEWDARIESALNSQLP